MSLPATGLRLTRILESELIALLVFVIKFQCLMRLIRGMPILIPITPADRVSKRETGVRALVSLSASSNTTNGRGHSPTCYSLLVGILSNPCVAYHCAHLGDMVIYFLILPLAGFLCAHLNGYNPANYRYATAVKLATPTTQ